jgi:hypothetical protein
MSQPRNSNEKSARQTYEHLIPEAIKLVLELAPDGRMPITDWLLLQRSQSGNTEGSLRHDDCGRDATKLASKGSMAREFKMCQFAQAIRAFELDKKAKKAKQAQKRTCLTQIGLRKVAGALVSASVDS